MANHILSDQDIFFIEKAALIQSGAGTLALLDGIASGELGLEESIEALREALIVERKMYVNAGGDPKWIPDAVLR